MNECFSGPRSSSDPDCLVWPVRALRRPPGERAIVVFIGSVLLALTAGPAPAQQWQIRPNANLELRYDDNVRLTTEDAESSFVSNARAAVRAIRSTENSNIGLAAGLSLNDFGDASDLLAHPGFTGSAGLQDQRVW